MVEMVYGTWDFNKRITDPVLLDHVSSLGTVVQNVCTLPHFRERMVYRILRKVAAETTATHLVVMRSGNIIDNFEVLNSTITEFCEQHDFGMAGHLINDQESYPWIHNQFFIMNMDFYRRVGTPYPVFSESLELVENFDKGGTPGSYMLPSYIRSEQNIHDTHTPLWIKSVQENCIEVVPADKFGQLYIACALRSGLQVVNFPHTIRKLKKFIYPDVSCEKFGKAILAVEANKTPDVADLYPVQKWYVTEFLPSMIRRSDTDSV